MIPQEEIDYIKSNADTLQVVQAFGVEMRRKGVNYVGLCPFHNEKTGSFTVNPRTNRWKCFGCQEGGNAVDFVMKKQGCDFIEAIKWLAGMMNYTLTDDYHETEEQKRRRTAAQEQRELNNLAAAWFCDQLKKNDAVKEYCKDRGWTADDIEQWRIGWAPDEWQGLWDYLRMQRKVRIEVLMASELFKQNKNGGYYCVFRGRLMFPIFDGGGDVIAFSGRVLDNSTPKYINTAEGTPGKVDIYHKGSTLFGWNFARRHAKEENEVILVEGNADVIRMHQIGVQNAVAACGTAFTPEQAQELARSVKRVVLLYDWDDAGQEHLATNGKIVEAAGMDAFVLADPRRAPKDDAESDDEENSDVAELQDKKSDPDSYFRSYTKFEKFYSRHKDSWYNYVVRLRKKRMGVNADPSEVSELVNELAPLLIKKDEEVQMGIVNKLAKIVPTKAIWSSAIKRQKQKHVVEVNGGGYTADEVKMIDVYGFCMKNNSYRVTDNPEGGYREVSNFVLEPLFHIESTINAKRLYRLKNNRGVVRELEIAQRDLVSLSAFKCKTESFGNFLFTGGDVELNKIKAYLYENTKTCREIEQLGWQKEGFWAWSNGVVAGSENGNATGAMKPVDELGTVEINGQWYYLPALSSFYKADTNLFVAERQFVHHPSKADLHTLASKMMTVYGNNAMVGICYYLATLFRDILFERYEHFPILNIFGQKGTGKTAMAITLLQLFGRQGSGPNMTSTTRPALADHISHYCNALVHIDEYKNSVEYEKIELLKGLYDGKGRGRMNMDRDKKKEVTPVDCGVILTGQETPTVDNALISRMIYLTVSQTKFSEEAKASYDDLKAYERQGLTGITNELIALREFVERNIEKNLNNVQEELRQLMNTRGIEGRILENWVMLLAVLRTLNDKVDLPFSYRDALPIFVSYIENQNSATRDSNEVSNFWRGIEGMLMAGEIELGYDIKIYKGLTNFRAYKNDGGKRNAITYSQEFDVLYLNTDRIFRLYSTMAKRVHDTSNRAVNEGTLRHYLITQEEYMGDCVKSFRVPMRLRENPSEGKQFSEGGTELRALHKNSRALVFNYARLKEEYDINLDIESSVDEDSEINKTEIPY